MPDLDELDLEEDAPVEKPNEDQVQELKRRCEAANLPFEFSPSDAPGFDEDAYRISFPCGREPRVFFLYTAEDFQQFLAQQFEKFSFLTEFEALVIRSEAKVEGAVRSSMGPGNIIRALSNKDWSEFDDLPNGSVLAETNRVINDSKLQIGICKMSDAGSLILRRGGNLSFVLQGFDVSTHDRTAELLRKISTAVFLQLDINYGIALSLVGRRPIPLRRRRRALAPPPERITFPEQEYDDAPASLYFYARSAMRMPLLQFLAFYQTIEFYFPIYSQASARRRIRLILKDPTFRADRDADLARVLTAVDPRSRGGIGDERAQLRATVAECVDENELRDFIESAPDMKAFLETKNKALTDVRISTGGDTIDLRQAVTDRIYDIRCRIVHTKGSDKEVELLLPSSKEAAMLGHDIELVQFVARKTLIAGSSKFNPA